MVLEVSGAEHLRHVVLRLMEWHSVSDSFAYSLRNSMPCRYWVASREWYAWWWTWYTGYYITVNDADSIIGRLNGFGPHKFEETWASVTRSDTNFWRSRI